MKILITGGAGLVGSHAAEFFARRGNQVILLDNLMRSSLFEYNKKSVEHNWDYLGRFKNILRIKGDVRNERDVLKALGKGVDAVIHTAAQPGVPSSVRMPRKDFSINAYGTLNLLECTRKRCEKAKIIYCSTNKVYGENVDKIPITESEKRYTFKGLNGVPESMPIDQTGHTPYGASKYVGDIYTQEYAHIYGMKTGVFRMGCIYGTRQFGFEEQGWVAHFVMATLTGRPITIYGNGKQVRDLLYVEDLIGAFDSFLKSPLRGGVFNIGGGPDRTISLLEFLDTLAQKLGKRPKVAYKDWRPSDQRVYISDISKARRALKWQPKTSVDEGLDKLITWAKKNIKLFI